MSTTTRCLPYEDLAVTNELARVRSYDDGGEAHDERERTTRARTTDDGRTLQQRENSRDETNDTTKTTVDRSVVNESTKALEESCDC